MKSPVKTRVTKSLDLERDLLLTEEDVWYMEKIRFENAGKVDLEAYLDFLEDIGAFSTKEIEFKIYPCNFEL
ncbi:MAG: hypothetical protein CVU64_10340 [Deltaproteobacteria bacterium HGW-Deltaproteobacteria-21]|nr:MAG: hypothetical protein CVU64_10340 [Deltaproteobacteria bacterium HGW-Deltaproteobacteria-21]